MEWWKSLQEQTVQRFQAWPDAMLTLALLVGAAVIAIIALSPAHPLFKAVVLAYIVLP